MASATACAVVGPAEAERFEVDGVGGQFGHGPIVANRVWRPGHGRLTRS